MKKMIDGLSIYLKKNFTMSLTISKTTNGKTTEAWTKICIPQLVIKLVIHNTTNV